MRSFSLAMKALAMTKTALTLVAALTAAEGDVKGLPPLCTKRQVASQQFANCSTRHIEKMVADGRFPAPIYLGRNPRWRRSDLLQWMNAQGLNQ
jgi:predicted DNA-binding transcriptional regulator AlpA